MSISDKELERLLQEAAERGADECLQKMGIGDDNIYEIKNMLDVFKAVKRGILQGISKLVMLIILATVAGATAYYGFDWGGK